MKKEELYLSPRDRLLLDKLDSSLFNSAMECMQRSQCNSRYVRHKSPSIVSARISPNYVKYIEKKEKEKKILTPIEPRIRPNILPTYNKSSIENKLTKEKLNSRIRSNIFSKEQKDIEQEKELTLLEITGLCSVQTHPFSENMMKKRKKLDQEHRRMSISFIENEKREKYYEQYYEKQRKVRKSKIVTRDLKKIEIREPKATKECSKRSKSNEGNYTEELVETCEISLQTPAFFTYSLPEISEIAK